MIWISLKKKEMKKIRPAENILYDWLTNYIPKPIKKGVGGFKDKTVSLFKTNTTKETVYGKGKTLSKRRKQNIKKPFRSEENKEKIKERTIRDIWKLFETEEEKGKRKESEKNKK